MKIDWLEFYINEVKIIEYKMYLKKELFEPDSISVSIYDSDDELKLTSTCDITSNSMGFLLTTDVTGTVGEYKGVYTVIKGTQTYFKKIKIVVREI